MTSITQALPAAFGPGRRHAEPALFVRFAAVARLSVTGSAAISSMSPTLTASGTEQETHLLKNGSDTFKFHVKQTDNKKLTTNHSRHTAADGSKKIKEFIEPVGFKFFS